MISEAKQDKTKVLEDDDNKTGRAPEVKETSEAKEDKTRVVEGGNGKAGKGFGGEEVALFS